MLSCHLGFCLGSVQMCISSLQPPNPIICQPCNEHSNEGKGESVGGSSCPMAVGATALAVEGQQPHHQHPQIGQLTPPLYKAVQLLCLEIQSLMQAVGSWGYTPLPLLWKASRPTMCNPKDGTAGSTCCAAEETQHMEQMIGSTCRDCCPVQLKAGRPTVYNP